MSKASEIAAFVRMTRGGLSIETLAKAIHRRWPDATEAEVREALVAAALSETGRPAPLSDAK